MTVRTSSAACGERYLNISDHLAELQAGQLQLRGRFCRLAASGTLHVCSSPDYRQQSLLIIALHADDAELAAFGLYSQAAQSQHRHPGIQGEIEAEAYQHLGLTRPMLRS